LCFRGSQRDALRRSLLSGILGERVPVQTSMCSEKHGHLSRRFAVSAILDGFRFNLFTTGSALLIEVPCVSAFVFANLVH
jgi:hypothetical protein